MLRNVVLGLAIAITLAGVAGLVVVGPAVLGWLIFGLLLVIGSVFERVRYKRLTAAAPDPRFRPTAERFRDPESGAVVRVYADPATGERAYVRD